MKYYEQAGNFSHHVQCAYMLDDFSALRQLLHQIPDGASYLADLGMSDGDTDSGGHVTGVTCVIHVM